jgi:hypothetical protein
LVQGHLRVRQIGQSHQRRRVGIDAVKRHKFGSYSRMFPAIVAGRELFPMTGGGFPCEASPTTSDAALNLAA